MAIDLKHRMLYIRDVEYRGLLRWSLVHRMPIPRLSEPQTKPAPPVVRRIEPLRQVPGGKIALSGQGFARTTNVVFIDTGTGENVEAKFSQGSDERLLVTVPKLSEQCTTSPIIVRANGSLTVTLPLNLHVIDNRKDRALRFTFKRFESDTTLPYWVKYNTPSKLNPRHSSEFVEAEQCVVFAAEPRTLVHSGIRGGNTFFLKDNTQTILHSSPNCVLYHEPFPNLWGPGLATDKIPETLRLVPVSAIRPSFVPKLFAFQREDRR